MLGKLDNPIRFQFGASESVRFPLLNDRIDSFGFINRKGGVDSKDRGAVPLSVEMGVAGCPGLSMKSSAADVQGAR